MRDASAFPHDYLNVLLHGLNGALLVLLVFRWTRDRLTAWLAGGIFVATAVVTEAVSGVVGLADVLGGAGALLALLALDLRLSFMPIALFAATMFGLYSKESALCIVPLVPVAALLTSQLTHPERPRAGRAPSSPASSPASASSSTSRCGGAGSPSPRRTSSPPRPTRGSPRCTAPSSPPCAGTRSPCFRTTR